MTGCQKISARFFGLLLILVLWATQGLCAKKKPPAHPVNLNTASASELRQVPGIGPATADKILQARKSYGKFKSVNDLQSIRGIGPKRLDKMRKYLTVDSLPQPKKAAPKTASSKSPPQKPSAGKSQSSTRNAPAESSEDDEP